MKRQVCQVMGCCLALAVAGCNHPDQAPPGGLANTATLPELPSSTPPPPMLAKNDQAFIAKAAGDNAFQIAMARLALQKSQDPKVRKLAQRIMDDHTRMNNELTAIATDRRTEHDSPAVPVDKARQLQDKLAPLQGAAFDHAFAGMMVTDHRTAIELFSSEIQNGHDEAVRAFARKELPTLREHLAMATALNVDNPKTATK